MPDYTGPPDIIGALSVLDGQIREASQKLTASREEVATLRRNETNLTSKVERSAERIEQLERDHEALQQEVGRSFS